MAYQSLYNRQTTLHATLRDLTSLTHTLSTLQLSPSAPTPSSDSEPEPDYATQRADLTADIHTSLTQCSEDLSDLTADIDDLAPPSSRHRARNDDLVALRTECVRLADDLSHLHARFRKAQLQSASNAARAAARERAAYLASLQAAATAYSPAAANDTTSDLSTTTQPARFTDLFAGRRPQRREQGNTNDAVLLSASSDVTASLKRTHTLLTNELAQSAFASSTLAESNAALRELNTRYESFSDLVARSAGLLGTLLRSQKSDTWFLETAVYALLGTLAWLVFRRLLYGPLWWVVYLPLSVVWRGASTAVGVAGVGRSGTTMGISSVATGVSSSVFPTQAQAQRPDTNAEQQNAENDQRSPEGSLSEQVGADAEAANAAARGERVVRGDGTELRARGEGEARNPMKRDWTEEEGPKREL